MKRQKSENGMRLRFRLHDDDDEKAYSSGMKANSEHFRYIYDGGMRHSVTISMPLYFWNNEKE